MTSQHNGKESGMADIVEIPVVWLQGGACSGCVVSLLNSFAPGAPSVRMRGLTRASRTVSIHWLRW